CNDKCKFIFPYYITEQESKANIHLRSHVKLAESLDRILVIPNVGSSRFAASSPFPPTFYYDFNLLKKMFPNAKLVPQEEYEQWIENQPNHKKIIAEHITLSETKDVNDIMFTKGYYEELEQQQDQQIGLYKSFTILKNSSNYRKQMNSINKNKNILYKFKINITKLKEVWMLMARKRDEFSEFMIKSLESDSQILLTNVRLKRSIFSNLNKPIPYAEHIRNEALKISNQLESSYIAIHWRMEGELPENMPNCAIELVKAIQKIREDTGIKNVYLATDFPITCEKNGSITMKILISAIKDIKTWKSLNAFGYLNYIGKEEKNNGDLLVNELQGSGVQGILDKLVCINSNYFLSGPEGCCKVLSSYTRQIANSREQLLSEGNKNILNSITRWKNNN
ncbi:7537_t:CDS:2, partial [Entrophospora sp. SA101]